MDSHLEIGSLLLVQHIEYWCWTQRCITLAEHSYLLTGYQHLHVTFTLT